MGKVLTYGKPSTQIFNNSVNVTTYYDKEIETSSCFINNANETSDATITLNDTLYTILAWSVSILPDCKKVACNTAKVNTQTSVMVKKPSTLVPEWVWMPKYAKDTILLGHGPIFNNSLVEQKAKSNGRSDYFWISMGVNGTYDFVLEKNVSINPGINQISLLSAIVGLKNYGAMYDTIATGVSDVQLIARKGDVEIIKNLSSSKWVNKVGLHGEEKQLYSVESRHASR
ncbi:hypothetical protein IFM89_010211 [Coptis chinensis]|uniref:Beta-galactosidase beta-sandwich domain-containing protein n=1 Tax=Coptis chinensis TaxID=261450 RepID=A0A835GYG6_9MAGN|nr:hypothetical protein IFM89_010211 [Coptis chinensis]